jgi:hypothetical protein
MPTILHDIFTRRAGERRRAAQLNGMDLRSAFVQRILVPPQGQ